MAAAADSSNIQYSDAPPTATGKESVKETPAKTSKAKNGGGTNTSNTPGSKESHSPEEESPGSTPSKSDAVPVAPSHGGGNGGSGQQGTQRSGSQDQSHGGAQNGSQTSKPVAATKDKGGGSSPLVPILIAIAVLAAISIGAVMLRQRRQRDGGGSAPSISPKAS